MGHIISLFADYAPTADVANELRGLLTSCTSAVTRHVAQRDLVRSALLLKRERVTLPAFRGRWFATGRKSERLGELINVLATVARTVDALDYIAAAVGGTVVKCNPSTSDCGHDIEVLTRERHVVVEVSDVAGKGNANAKMSKDLATLVQASPDVELLLAVSENSGRWLTNTRTSIPARLGVKCTLVTKTPPDSELATWIVGVERTPATPSQARRVTSR